MNDRKKRRQDAFRVALTHLMRGHKQVWLQEVTGVAQQNISKILGSKRGVSETKMEQLLKPFGVSVEEALSLGERLSGTGSNVINMHTNHGTVSPVINNSPLPHMGEIAWDLCETIARKMARMTIDEQFALRAKIKALLDDIPDEKWIPKL